ncbi:hypothetical protein PPO43_10575 [Saprospira sp. CCB-QB6]|uniref:hypothetical protein n=1 Tax=Saprospira sp. CCB-QB6 TaxID=3023936 RepID=UPI00234A1411|nr:hypothetical protein [Saprospira sp. CCB-QB6]WCL80415.1 hypothetical protein PPO43_10575 [Saprospira sp. CCB-QB6]
MLKPILYIRPKPWQIAISVLGLCWGLATAFTSPQLQREEEQSDFQMTESTPLWTVMGKLGKIKTNQPKDWAKAKDQLMIQQGKDLIEKGFTNKDGSSSELLSKTLSCSSCHLSVREEPSLDNLDPQKRLKYVDSNQLSFLPGPSFYGMINRIFFFNNDFAKLYDGPHAPLLKDAHFDLRKAMNACNQLFADGRKMEDWEQEAILAYLWTLELKMGELEMKKEDWEKVEYSIKNNRSNARAVNLIRRYYSEVYPAHLVRPPDVRARQMVSPASNSFLNGRKIYEKSCLHCHEEKRYSRFKLDSRQKTFKRLAANFEGKAKLSIYSAHRYQSGKNWKGVPIFTKERMSDEQLGDLRFFIDNMAKMGDEALNYYKN